MVAAAIALIRTIPESDPFWQAAMRAPLDHGPIPEEELQALGGATEPFIDGDVVSAQVAALRPR